MPPYYDRIAGKWHAVTGSRGGALKRFLLNDLLIDRMPEVAGRAILELGAGNGYFLPLAFRRFSGQVPSRVVITDQSRALLDLARRSFPLSGAEYSTLDVRRPFPFPEGAFDLIVASMLFNELPTAGLRHALGECRRVLTAGGRLLATVTHPAFVESLVRRGELKPLAGAVQTMPGAEGLRLPVVRRRAEEYAALAEGAGLRLTAEEVYPSEEVLSAKPGLRKAGRVPVALVMEGVWEP
jgi:SAM-dependent methyltransferase